MRLSVFVEIGLRLGRVDTVDFGTSERARLAVTVGHVTAEGVGAGKAPCSAVSVTSTAWKKSSLRFTRSKHSKLHLPLSTCLGHQ